MIECFFFLGRDYCYCANLFFYYTLLRRLFDVTVGKVVD